MLSDPRSIAFITECIHAPHRPSTQSLQKVYSRLVESGPVAYANFNILPVGARMTTVHGPASIAGATSHSTLVVSHDRIQITEEWPSLSLDDYVDRLERTAGLLMDEMGIATFVATQCCVRSLVSAQSYPNSLDFFNERFFRLDEQTTTDLGRMPNLFGIRLAFPPLETGGDMHNVRAESFAGDARSMFLEDSAVYPRPVMPNGCDQLGVAFRATYDFLTGPVVDYLRTVASRED